MFNTSCYSYSRSIKCLTRRAITTVGSIKCLTRRAITTVESVKCLTRRAIATLGLLNV